MPEPQRRGRHRAATTTTRSPAAPLLLFGRLMRAVLGTPGRRLGAVAAAASVALGAFTASALTPVTAQADGTGQADGSVNLTSAAPAADSEPAPEVSADPAADWGFDTPEITVEPIPEPTPTLTRWQPSRSASRGPAAIPAHIAAYGNGRLPVDVLTSIGDGHYLWGPAAEAYTALVAAAAADGVHFSITDSYRSYDAQVSVANRKGIYGRGGLAAVPGTSNHGWGLSLDLNLNNQARAWMRSNAGRFGFVEDVAGEPWHWTYHG